MTGASGAVDEVQMTLTYLKEVKFHIYMVKQPTTYELQAVDEFDLF